MGKTAARLLFRVESSDTFTGHIEARHHRGQVLIHHEHRLQLPFGANALDNGLNLETELIHQGVVQRAQFPVSTQLRVLNLQCCAISFLLKLFAGGSCQNPSR